MKNFIMMFALLSSCGLDPSGEPEYREPRPAAPVPVPQQPVNPWSSEIKSLVQEQCGLAGCHAGASFIASGESFKASSSLRRVQSGNMPLRSSPNYGIYNDSKKRKLIDYLSSP